MFEAERIAGTDFEPNRLIEFLRPPFRKFEVSTTMSPAQAESVLLENVEPARFFKWPSFREHKYFEGKVAGGRFKIQRFINYENSWLPVIMGSFRPDNSGTIVNVTVRLMWSLTVFSCGIILFFFWGFAYRSIPAWLAPSAPDC